MIALCNSDEEIPEFVMRELIKGAKRKRSYGSVDTNALILTALSCVSSSNITLQNEVHRTKSNLAQGLTSKQNAKTGAFGNQYSSALAVEVNIQIRENIGKGDFLYIVTYILIPFSKAAGKPDTCRHFCSAIS